MEAILSDNASFTKIKKTDFYLKLFVVILIILSSLSIYFLKPSQIEGDGITYEESILVLESNTIPEGFLPNRILTTFLGLEAVLFLGKIFGNLQLGWIFLNTIFYFILNIAFYQLVLKIFHDPKVAFLSGLLLAGNYSAITFGLNYLMDIGGWAFYILSLYFLFSYIQSNKNKELFLASLAVGIGGLFKEYAFLGIISIACYLLYTHKLSWNLIKKSIIPALLSSIPILLVYLYVYIRFDYTYLDWFSYNQSHYIYSSRILEYIKSTGSLFNFLGVLFLGGLYFLWKDRNILDKNTKLFIVFGTLSVLPIFFWPAITQRILFIIVPIGIIISGIFIKKYIKFFPVFLLIVCLYIVSNFFMDSFLLNVVNLPF